MAETPAFLRALERRPLLSIILGALMISFSAVFVKLVSAGPDTAAFYRVLFGGAGLALLSLLMREPLRLHMGALALLAAAALSLAMDLGMWHRSISLTGPGLATICINFQVFIVALWGRAVYREALPLRVLLGMPLALVGLWLLAGVDVSAGEGVLQGVVWGLLAAVAFAAYILFVRASQNREKRLAPMANMAVVSLATALLLGLYCLGRGTSLAIDGFTDGFLLLAYGLVSQGAGWLFISIGLPRVKASVGGLALLIMPTFSFIWDIVFFARPTGFWGFCGVVLAIFAIRLGMSGAGGKPPAPTAAG